MYATSIASGVTHHATVNAALLLAISFAFLQAIEPNTCEKLQSNLPCVIRHLQWLVGEYAIGASRLCCLSTRSHAYPLSKHHCDTSCIPFVVSRDKAR